MAADIRSRSAGPVDDDDVVMSFEPPPPPLRPTPQPAEPQLDEFGLPPTRARSYSYDEERDGEVLEPVVVPLPRVRSEEAEAAPVPIASPGPKRKKKATEATPAASAESTSTKVKPTETKPTETKPTETKSAEMKPPTETAADKRASMASLPERDRKTNEVKMFSEDPKDPHMPAGTGTVSEWSHQQQVPLANSSKKEETKIDEWDGEWQTMPAYASQDLYDDNGRLIAKAIEESDDENPLGGASKGYTRVYDDEDAESATSMDENTQYLFKEDENDDASRNPLSQMQATKELLTEGQRVAYVGVCRLAMREMQKDVERYEAKSRTVKKGLVLAVESMKMWSQKMMVRLYTHMEISPPEQVMIEQLGEHGVLPSDLTPTLMKNSRVANPMASTPTNGTPRSSVYSPRTPIDSRKLSFSSMKSPTAPPPAYEDTVVDDMPDVRTPSQLPESKTLDIDIRWTVLCDLFLVLIADSVYDARSRVLMERVGQMMDVPWMGICKFEKRVTDALEMQEATEQNWSEKEHLENRERQARNKRYMMLGLATVGGSLVIGLSGGLLAPMIGAGLAAGFTTIGVAGTGSFLAGVGGTAMIATGATVSGGYIGGRAGFNRTKAVRTFEFRPLHNAKRVNLIVTVSGWMNGKIDDVRLPYSTVDPVMGDLFAVHWEPEVLQSMGQTLNILATEALTQSLQQVLGSTILIGLMSAIQLPVVLTKLSYLLDNPWSVSLDRASAAGLILADSLMHRNLGVRPVTLVGYSLGARVIYSCLRELARHGAYGLVQNAYLFGSPVVVKQDEYSHAKSVVPGRFVNGYATNDWILGYLFRATSGGIGRVAGLAAIDTVPGVENVDCTTLVNGHMDYRTAVPRLLRHVGWEVSSDEFSEIEDPDPDNHQERQRELINELDEARKELEKAPQKKQGRFSSLFSRNKQAKKAIWETYEPSGVQKPYAAEGGDILPAVPAAPAAAKTSSDAARPSTAASDPNATLLFDIDAIRAEIARDAHGGNSSSIGGGDLSYSPPFRPTLVGSTGASPIQKIESQLPAMTLSPTPAIPYSAGPRASKSWSDLVNSTGSRSGSRSNSLRGPPMPTLRSVSSSGPRKPSEYDTLPEDDSPVQLQFEPDPQTDRPRPSLRSAWTEPGDAYGGTGRGSGSGSGRMGSFGKYGALGGGGGGGYAALGGAGRNVWLDDDEDDEFAPKEDSELTLTFA